MAERCDHAGACELRWKLDLSRQRVAVWQCQKPSCLKELPGSRISMSKLSDEHQTIYAFKTPSSPRMTKRRSEFLLRYKRSDWKPIVREACERDNWVCGGENCEEIPVTAHHINYLEFGHGGVAELETVVASCARCNTQEWRYRHGEGLLK